uniref:N-acetyltransferase domain-containing protein n=1 Tax=Stomoxys calcitrans TaxID=35570 RepID=A0A1I8NR67_STOCA
MFRRSILPLAKNLINLDYRLITLDRYKDVMFHLRDMSAQTDPLNKTICECIRKGGDEFVEYFTYKTLNDELSLMALNSQGNIVGIVLNGVANPEYLQDLKNCLAKIRDSHLQSILQLQLEENMKNNIFDLCKTRKVFETRLLSVDSRNYNGRIMGKQLIRLSEIVAGNKDHKVMKADATGNFSQKIFSYCGFKCLNEVPYNNYSKKDDNSIKLRNLPHSKYQLLYKLLR